MNIKRPSSFRGFTIIELLVATAITALLMTLMVTIITGVTKSWNASSGKLTAGGQARLILDQITKDLQCAIFRSDGNTWMAADIVPDAQASTWVPSGQKTASESDDPAAMRSSLTTNEKGAIANARFGVSGVWLRFFTNQPGTNTTGNLDSLSAPVAVSYRLLQGHVSSSTASTMRYMLYRAQVSPTETFQKGYNIVDTSVYPTGSAPAASGTAQSIYYPALTDVLAENVVDFGIRMYVKEAIGGVTNLRLVFPATATTVGSSPATGTLANISSIAATDTQTHHYSKSGTTTASDYYANTFPDVIEVMIRVLSDEGAQQIGLLEKGVISAPSGLTTAQYWWQIVEANSTVYTRRIEINAKAF